MTISHRGTFNCGLLLLLLWAVTHAFAQDPEVLKSRVLTAIREASLMSPNVKPYRMVATIVVFDGAGKNPQAGSLEQVRSGRNVRTTVTFPGASVDVLNTAKGNYFSEQGTTPYYATSLVKFLHTPLVFKGFGEDAPVRPAGIPTDLKLDCISITPNSAALVRGPEPLVYEVCLDPDADDLRVVVDDKLVYVRNEVVAFDGQRIARRIDLRLGNFVVGKAEIMSLEHVTPDETLFVPSADMKPLENAPERIPGAVMAGRILQHENPRYPRLAKAARIQGVVVLRAMIGVDGHIRDLTVISSPDKLLSDASLEAVKKWTYEPYTMNGKPTSIETTITVSFAMGK